MVPIFSNTSKRIGTLSESDISIASPNEDFRFEFILQGVQKPKAISKKLYIFQTQFGFINCQAKMNSYRL